MDKLSNENEPNAGSVPSPGKSTTTSPEKGEEASSTPPTQVVSQTINPLEAIIRRHLSLSGIAWPVENLNEVNRIYRIVPPIQACEVIEEEEEVSPHEFQDWEPPKGMPYPPSTPSSTSSEDESEVACELKIEEVSIQFEEIDLNLLQIEEEIEDPLLIDPLFGSSPAA